ncbi:MAG: DUF167 domain-containing protein [Heliobacteriaceae bacterium]|jgi:uncharacterized protein (TIGR00251 family)|nr:DUF167 domain-containing protein [Heliobacteriaceae bacterium]
MEEVKLQVRITPNASRNEVTQDGDLLKVKLTAPPVDGKANKALLEILSKYFKIPKTSIKIIKGETSKNKLLLLKM